MDDVDLLKQKLSAALQSDGSATDYSLVLNLANQLSKYDHENVRFSIDASHISRLGHELVSKQETAVAELVKNAYDADAVSVEVTFKNTSDSGGELIIADTGLGMNHAQLVNGFMRISTKDKSDNPLSEKYLRQRAGRKGIGRFSAQRLGNELEINTRRIEEHQGLHLDINWRKFEEAGDLILVTNQVRASDDVRVGTTLKIKDLKDGWSHAQIQRTYRYIADLLQPFPLEGGIGESRHDPGFKVKFFEEVDGVVTEVASEEKNILAHAQAVISGSVNEHGTALFSMSSNKYKIYIADEVLNVDPRVKTDFGVKVDTYKVLTGVRFKVHYFIDEHLPAGTRGMVRSTLNRYGGVRVYRNGFRVLPYGEPNDDWLGLQRSSALRQLLPPHHSANFLGFVEIHDVSGINFEETASREGLIENDAFRHLQDLIYKELAHGVIKVAAARNKKLFAGKDTRQNINVGTEESDEEKSPQDIALEVIEVIKEMAESVHAAKPVSANGSISYEVAYAEETAKVEALIEKVASLGASSQSILEENGMLRVLASLGLTIAEFTHETRHILGALVSGVSNLVKGIPEDQNAISLRENIQALQSYMRYFDSSVTQNAQRTLEVFEIKDLVNEFLVVIDLTTKRQHVKVEKQFNGYDLFTKPSHKSEWTSILFNLFTNSLKAIKRAGVPGQILIRAGEVGDDVFLEFIDNGDGVPFDMREKVFEPFVTTSARADALADDELQITGSGLGLKIVKDIIESASGVIYLIEAPAGFSTCFRLEFPRALDEEIPDELR